MSDVTVIIPTYNRLSDLMRALASLRAQTEPGWQAIIVDNHSVDGTPEAVAALADPRIRLELVHNNGVVAYSRNVGIRAATTEYIAFLDSDDWWAPGKLAESLRRLRAGADVVYHDLYLVFTADQAHFRKRARTRALHAPVFRDLVDNGNGLATSSVVMRREFMVRAGCFVEEERWVGWEDYDTWMRIAQLTDRFERIDEPLGYYWFGGGNISTPKRLLMNLAAFRAKYIDTPRAPLTKPPGWFHYLMGRGCYDAGDLAAVPAHMRRVWSEPSPMDMKFKALYLAARAVLRRRAAKAA